MQRFLEMQRLAATYPTPQDKTEEGKIARALMKALRDREFDYGRFALNVHAACPMDQREVVQLLASTCVVLATTVDYMPKGAEIPDYLEFATEIRRMLGREPLTG